MPDTCIAWMYTHTTGWRRIGSASSLSAAIALTCRLYPREMAKQNWRFGITSGGVPTWTPRRAKEAK